MKTHSRGLLAAMIFAATAAGCAWVDLKPQAEKVRVLAAQEVGRCKLLGKVTATTAANIGFIARSRDTVQEEIHRLARNHAASMNGDTIVAVDRLIEGEQSFNVYRCIMP
jgi:hypothetical protein